MITLSTAATFVPPSIFLNGIKIRLTQCTHSIDMINSGGRGRERAWYCRWWVCVWLCHSPPKAHVCDFFCVCVRARVYKQLLVCEMLALILYAPCPSPFLPPTPTTWHRLLHYSTFIHHPLISSLSAPTVSSLSFMLLSCLRIRADSGEICSRRYAASAPMASERRKHNNALCVCAMRGSSHGNTCSLARC